MVRLATCLAIAPTALLAAVAVWAEATAAEVRPSVTNAVSTSQRLRFPYALELTPSIGRTGHIARNCTAGGYGGGGYGGGRRGGGYGGGGYEGGRGGGGGFGSQTCYSCGG